MDGKGYGVGNYTGELNIAPSTQPWYLPAKTLNGHRYLSASQNWLAFPLTKMYHFLSNIDPRDLFNEIQMEDSGIIEIDKLRDSLNSAMRSQKASTQAMLLLKEQELQAQMLALQAQMNPHFLYNSLNTIGAMAEEGMNSEVTKMCQDITSILRYISSDKESVSTVEEELEHCDLYLKCIKFIFKYPRLWQSYPRTVITEKELTQCFR